MALFLIDETLSKDWLPPDAKFHLNRWKMFIFGDKVHFMCQSYPDGEDFD